jgi:hypothetical protein
MTPVDPRQLQSVERLREQYYFKVVHSVYFFICQRTPFIDSVSENNLMCGLWVAHYRQTSALYYTATNKLHVPEPERPFCGF